MKIGLAARIPVTLTALAIGAMLAACGGEPATPTAPPAPSPTTPPTAEPTATPEAVKNEPQPVAEGWQLYTLEQEGVALSLPPNWQAIDFDEEAVADNLEKIRAANPDLANSLSEQAAALAMQGIKFYAIDLDSPSLAVGFATNVNIIRHQGVATGDLDSAMTESSAEVKQQFGTLLDGAIRKGKLNAGSGEEVGRLSYDVALSKSDGSPLPMSITQYLGVTDGDVYIITCTMFKEYSDDYAPTFDSMAAGIYFLK